MEDYIIYTQPTYFTSNSYTLSLPVLVTALMRIINDDLGNKAIGIKSNVF